MDTLASVARVAGIFSGAKPGAPAPADQPPASQPAPPPPHMEAIRAAEMLALAELGVALGALGPTDPSATPASASAARLGVPLPCLHHAAVLHAER